MSVSHHIAQVLDALSNEIEFDPTTGLVRATETGALLFRMDKQGLYLWDKRAKEEIRIPWPQISLMGMLKVRA